MILTKSLSILPEKYKLNEIQILLGMQGEFINKIAAETVAQKLF